MSEQANNCNSMKQYIQSLSVVLMVFSLALSAVVLPVMGQTAIAQSNPSFSFEQPDYFTNNTADTNQSGNTVSTSESAFIECTLSASKSLVAFGGSVTLDWDIESSGGLTTLEINGESHTGFSGSTIIENLETRTVFTLEAINESGASCTQVVIVDCEDPPVILPPECTLTPATQTIAHGGTATLTWTTANAGEVTLTDFGVVNANGSVTTGPLVATKTYTLTATATDDTEDPVSCTATVVVEPPEEDPAPTCDTFFAAASTIVVGDSTVLTWETSNATEVFINNGIGAVSLDGSLTVTPIADVTYQLTAVGTENRQATCTTPITVSTDPVPACIGFSANPNQLPVGGGATTLAWEVENANAVSIAPLIGSTTATGTEAVTVQESTVFTLTATDTNGDETQCVAPVTVADPEPVFTCGNNVVFTASDTSIERGERVDVTWSTTDVDSVSISGITATTLSGSETVAPSNDITYTLTATQNTETISCPISINVSSGGGGGGGSASPRCELEISDTQIDAGDTIELEWETSSVSDIILVDDTGEVLFTTEEFLADDKREYFDAAITLKPTKDTEYTLTAKRGFRDRECQVSVRVTGDEVVVLEDREQDLVAGISLAQVPYTGFEAGPVLTTLFYLLLVIWALYISYLIIMRRNFSPETDIHNPSPLAEAVSVNESALRSTEVAQEDRVTKDVQDSVPVGNTVPSNLPTGTPAASYEQVAGEVTTEESEVTALENQAHAQRTLLSSDAVRCLMNTVAESTDRSKALDTVIAEAKQRYPLEDGWLVLNETRMQNLCTECVTHSELNDVVPVGSGSLAEAIVTGNIVAAYELIGTRPMFSLADAAADLDALYRHRRGGQELVSELLKAETAQLSEAQISNMINALTSALDGTYTDEVSAVKMAIMKAVKEVT